MGYSFASEENNIWKSYSGLICMKRNAIVILVSAVIVALLFAGCTTQPPTVPSTTPSTTIPTATPTASATPVPTSISATTLQPPQINGTWTLISALAGLGASNVLPGTKITAVFSDGGTVSGSSGCNNYVAAYDVSRTNKLTIGKLATSKTNCVSPAGIMDQESIYLTNLQGAASFTITNDKLIILDSAGKTLLTYQSGGTIGTTLPIGGITWNLSMYRPNSGSNVPPAANATALFGPARNLTGSAGCNSYSGVFTTSGLYGLSIGPLATTQIYCGEPGVMDQETAYLANLRKVASYEVTKDGMLNLKDSGGTPVLMYSS